MLEPDTGLLGRVETRSLWQSEYMQRDDAMQVAQWRVLAARDIVISLAGPIAELRCRGHSRWAVHLASTQMGERCLQGEDQPLACDFQQVRKRLTWLFDAKSRPEQFSAAWVEAGERVARYWTDIRALGQAVERSGTLDEDEVLAFARTMKGTRKTTTWRHHQKRREEFLTEFLNPPAHEQLIV